jgi:hypothetical protein
MWPYVELLDHGDLLLGFEYLRTNLLPASSLNIEYKCMGFEPIY